MYLCFSSCVQPLAYRLFLFLCRSITLQPSLTAFSLRYSRLVFLPCSFLSSALALSAYMHLTVSLSVYSSRIVSLCVTLVVCLALHCQFSLQLIIYTDHNVFISYINSRDTIVYVCPYIHTHACRYRLCICIHMHHYRI